MVPNIEELSTDLIVDMAAMAKRWGRRWQYKALEQSTQGFISWQADQLSP